MTVPTFLGTRPQPALVPRLGAGRHHIGAPAPWGRAPAEGPSRPATLTSGQESTGGTYPRPYGHHRCPLGARPPDLVRACSSAHARGCDQREPVSVQHTPARPVPFAACCCSRILRVRGVVPLGMLMMYFPSISAVTLRLLVGTVRLSSSRWARAAGEEGGVSAFWDGRCSQGRARCSAKGTHRPLCPRACRTGSPTSQPPHHPGL